MEHIRIELRGLHLDRFRTLGLLVHGARRGQLRLAGRHVHLRHIDIEQVNLLRLVHNLLRLRRGFRRLGLGLLHLHLARFDEHALFLIEHALRVEQLVELQMEERRRPEIEQQVHHGGNRPGSHGDGRHIALAGQLVAMAAAVAHLGQGHPLGNRFPREMQGSERDARRFSRGRLFSGMMHGGQR